MKNNFKKSLLVVITCLLTTTVWGADVTFVMSNIFDGSNLSAEVTTPVAATVSTNASKSNAKDGKLGSDGHYFQIVLKTETFSAASINGYINTTNTGKNWAFQFSTDGGNTWSAEQTQANDGNKNLHDISVDATIPSGANGFRVIRKAGTSTVVKSITLTIGGSAPPTPVSVTGVSLDKTSLTLDINDTYQLQHTVLPNDASNKNVSWSSNNTSVATVTNGLVTAKSAGTAKITVTTEDGNKTATCDVTVNDPVIHVTGVTLNKNSLTLEAGKSEKLIATVTPDDATNKNVSWSSNNSAASVDQDGTVHANSAGTATITVTTVDGNKTATCTVTVTTPTVVINVTGVTISPKTLTLEKGKTGSLSYTIAPTDATNKAVTWSSDNTSVATVNNGIVTAVAIGNANITVTTADQGFTDVCSVTVKEAAVPVTSVTLSPSSLSLEEGETSQLTHTVLPTDASNKNVSWSSSNTSVATVSNGLVTAKSAGTATITVTTEDGNKTASCTVTVTAAIPIPQTDLTLHEPDIYEAPSRKGGYEGTLSKFNDREYEVFYINRDGNSNLSVTVTNVEKSGAITTPEDDKNTKAADGWFKLSSNGTSSSTNGVKKDEFDTSVRCAKLLNNQSLELHVKGFDQFSFYGKDNNADASKGRHFELYIDDVKQSMTPTDSYTIRRFDISTKEHVIRLVGIGGSNNEITGFSLRVSDQPRVKWVSGNDSTQSVYQTAALSPITYCVRNSNKADSTVIRWNGKACSGITLAPKSAGNDTLILSGNANGSTGKYTYRVVVFKGGAEVSSASGAFSVRTGIENTYGLTTYGYVNEDIDPAIFRCFADTHQHIDLTWAGGVKPNKIDTTRLLTDDHNIWYFSLGCNSTTAGTFSYTISIEGGEKSIDGKIIIQEVQGTKPGESNKVYYMYRDSADLANDYIYKKLGATYNFVPHQSRLAGVLPRDQYDKYQWIYISENVNADNLELLQILKSGVNKPVLNMKGFAYSAGRVSEDGWGVPNNGTVDTTANNHGCKIFVNREDHPIFKALNKSHGATITVFSQLNKKGVMPIYINNCDGSLCLATAYTRNTTAYYADGELQTVMHEIPLSMRPDRKKYICLPLAQSSCPNLTSEGEALIKQIVSYLLSNESTVALKELELTSFKIDGVAGSIDQNKDLVELTIDIKEHPSVNISAVVPKTSVKDPTYTHVVPLDGQEINFSTSESEPVTIEVTDYINRRPYDVIVHALNAQGIEQVSYTPGEWINIYDIYGRKIATTNEDFYKMDIPHGIYLIVNENGQTIKLYK